MKIRHPSVMGALLAFVSVLLATTETLAQRGPANRGFAAPRQAANQPPRNRRDERTQFGRRQSGQVSRGEALGKLNEQAYEFKEKSDSILRFQQDEQNRWNSIDRYRQKSGRTQEQRRGMEETQRQLDQNFGRVARSTPRSTPPAVSREEQRRSDQEWARLNADRENRLREWEMQKEQQQQRQLEQQRRRAEWNAQFNERFGSVANSTPR